ncbi:hypothetical protein J7E45_11410 [Microbacterium sp. ISL-59]|uniref:hypothetical protein n=1 Tax=Microbacterium sp. ISL-59 TaxID=2819159 RepID=UPI001BE5F845|nr:hypothetical protein [Microbacterium sp. ISL-59]MBT2496215.1 hypothetical protein [Microbacterium sp. ISL-59]
MAIELNRPAVKFARSLVREGRVVRDERADWSEAAPSADEENRFIEKHGWTQFSHWHLGVDRGENSETKQAYTFPFGDFRAVRRSGVISTESRAGQHGHTEMKEELRKLLELIDSADG